MSRGWAGSDAAHPDSLKRDLRWDGWSDPSTGSSRQHRHELARAARRSIFQVLTRRAARRIPVPISRDARCAVDGDRNTINRWLDLTEQRPIVAVAGHDAHAQIGLWEFDLIDTRFALPIPGYETSFRFCRCIYARRVR
jgi:hypothetical protein